MKLRLLLVSLSLIQGLVPVLSADQDSPRLVLQKGHPRGINKVAFATNGSILVSLGSEGTIKLWDTESGRFLYDLEDTKKFSSFAISPDGSVLATSQLKGTYYDYSTGASIIKVWQLKTRTFLHEFEGNGLQLAFSPDGKTISTGGIDIALFDVMTGNRRLLIHFPAGLITHLAFSPNGNSLISSTNIGTLNISSASDGKLFKTISDNQEGINSFALSPDGNLIFYASSTRMTLRKVSSGKIVFTQQTEKYKPFFNSGQLNYVMDVAFSTNGKYLATAHDGGNVNILDSKTGTLLYKIQTHNDRIVTIAFAPDSTLIASASILTSYDNKTPNIATIKLSNAATGKMVRDFGGFVPSIGAMILSPDEKTLFASKNDFGNTQGNGKVDIWKLKNSDKLTSLTADKDPITRLAISADGKKLATSGYGKTTRIWDVKAGNTLLNVDEALIAAFGAPDTLALGFQSVVGSPESVRTPDIEIRDLKTNVPPKRFQRAGEGISSLTFASNGKVLIASTGSRVEIRNVENGALVKELLTLSSGTFAAALSPDGNILASGGDSRVSESSAAGVVQLWNTKTWEAQPPMFDETGWIRALAFNSDGRILASGGDGKYLILWDARTGKKIQDFQDEGITSIAFSKNDNYLFTGGVGGLKIFKRQLEKKNDVSYQELCQLASLNDGTWVVAATDGRFDTNNLEEIRGLHWIVPDDPLRPLPLEIFMRDYYEPRLLSRLLDCNSQNNCEKEFGVLPSLAELNRLQPVVNKITVLPRRGAGDLVNVKVEVSSVTGDCLRGNKQQPCESGVYDLRLYRDGHLVAQVPAKERTLPTSFPHRVSTWRDQLQTWRETSVVKNKRGEPVRAALGSQKVIFEGIRLPSRTQASEVEFTAYAFNEDRVKSATTEPVVYRFAPRRTEIQRRAYVITVGVDWTSADWRLGFAPKSAREVEQLLTQNFQAQRFQVVPVQLLSAYKENSSEVIDLATKENLQTVLNILAGRSVPAVNRQRIPAEKQLRRATPDDVLVLYIASHGYADPSGKFYVVPSHNGDGGVSEDSLTRCLKNLKPDCDAERKFLQLSISSDELAQWIQAIDAGQMVLVLDSCHSGAVSGPGFKPGPMGDRGFGQLSYDKGMLVLAATQREQLAWGTLGLGDLSLLTYVLTQPLPKTQSLDLGEWLRNAERRVPDIYEEFVKSNNFSASSTDANQEPTLFDFSKKQRSSKN
jgi:WD40 repeat protein